MSAPPFQADLEEAQKLFLKVILGNWNRTAEIELFCLEELNALIAWIDRSDWPDQPDKKPPLIALDPRLRKNLDLDLRIVMSWDADATDVDLHVVEPSGTEAYYGNKNTPIRGLVTADIQDGYGPEAYLLRSAPAGDFLVKAKYFGSRQQTLIGPATVTVRAFTNWGRENESSQLLTLRLDQRGSVVEIGKIKIGAAGTATAWNPLDIATLRIGTAEKDVVEKLGKPARAEDNALFYVSGTRTWKLLFEKEKLLRVSELLPGNAEMIVVQ